MRTIGELANLIANGVIWVVSRPRAIAQWRRNRPQKAFPSHRTAL